MGVNKSEWLELEVWKWKERPSEPGRSVLGGRRDQDWLQTQNDRNLIWANGVNLEKHGERAIERMNSASSEQTMQLLNAT